MLTHKGTRSIYTSRLCLRRYRIEDVINIFKNYATDKRVTKFLSWQPYEKIETLERFVEDQVLSYTDNKYNWVIEYTSQVIGSVSVIREDEQNESCEIGYCIGRDFWGKGITTEAVTAVLQYLFCEVGYHRIFAKHDVDNPASGKVMQKCNMIYEGRLRGYYLRHDGAFSDTLVYSILKDEFQKDLRILIE